MSLWICQRSRNGVAELINQNDLVFTSEVFWQLLHQMVLEKGCFEVDVRQVEGITPQPAQIILA